MYYDWEPWYDFGNTFNVDEIFGDSRYWKGRTSNSSSQPPSQESSSSKKKETSELGGSEVLMIPRASDAVLAASGRIWNISSYLVNTATRGGEGRESVSSYHGQKKTVRERTVHEKKGVKGTD